MFTTDQQVRDFIAGKAAELALATKSDRLYVSCFCMMFGNSSVKKQWAISVGNLSTSYQGDSFESALESWRALTSPDAKLKRAEKLREEAAELEREANAGAVPV